MPRKAQPRQTLPSGIQRSANGNYFYWHCTVSGLETFADENRFKDVVKKYGSEEKLFKSFVLRPVKKYVEAGFSPETIKEIAQKHNGKLPSLDDGADAEMPKKQRKQPPLATGNAHVEVEPIKVYPWTGNPDFFKSPESAMSVADVTREACLYPNRQLDDECRGCPVYAECICSAKFSEDDWKKASRKKEVKITPIRSFDV